MSSSYPSEISFDRLYIVHSYALVFCNHSNRLSNAKSNPQLIFLDVGRQPRL